MSYTPKFPTLAESISDFHRLTEWFSTNPGFSDRFCDELVQIEDMLFDRIMTTPSRCIDDIRAKLSLMPNQRIMEHEGRPERIANVAGQELLGMRAAA